MEAAARALPDGVRVELRAKLGSFRRGAGIRPIEDRRGRRAGGIDPHQAVPERGATHGRDAGGGIAEVRDDPIDSPHGQIEQRFSRESGAAVRCRLQFVTELLDAVVDGVTQAVEP